jgi:nucleolar protein 56
MKGRIFVTELGVLILDKPMKTMLVKKYPIGEDIQRFRQIELGEIDDWFRSIIVEAKKRGFDEFLIYEEALRKALDEKGFNVKTLSDGEINRLQNRKLRLIVAVGWSENENKAKELIRVFALELSNVKLRELAAKPDLQIMQSVQALDEIDKVVNILEARVKEWYGLHFPELERILDSPEAYIKFVNNFERRENIAQKKLEEYGFTSEKAKEILSAADRSKGTELRNEDLQKISSLSKEATQLSSVRDSLAKHVEKTMNQFAPNIASVAGETIGARLIVKAGGLEKIARLPASTIQVLGAEKALFRAIRTGARPPKHGILFQHQAVHVAPKWQRGKIARSLAAKIAIASRVDAYRGTRENGLKEKFEQRLEDIKEKYGEQPKTRNLEFKKMENKSDKKRRKSKVKKSKVRRQR